jgi:hypothetical protein
MAVPRPGPRARVLARHRILRVRLRLRLGLGLHDLLGHKLGADPIPLVVDELEAPGQLRLGHVEPGGRLAGEPAQEILDGPGAGAVAHEHGALARRDVPPVLVLLLHLHLLFGSAEALGGHIAHVHLEPALVAPLAGLHDAPGDIHRALDAVDGHDRHPVAQLGRHLDARLVRAGPGERIDQALDYVVVLQLHSVTSIVRYARGARICNVPQDW